MKKETMRKLPTLGLVLIGLLIALFYRHSYQVTILCQMICYFIVAMGLNFLTGLSGQANMGTGGIFALGAYFSALLAMRLNISPWLAIIPATAMGWVVGKVLGYPSLRVEGVYLSLTTIAFGEIIRICINNATDLTAGALGLKGIPPFRIGGIDFSTPNNMLVLLIFIALIITYISDRIIRSRWGRAMIAIRDNVEAASSCGIDVAALKIKAFTLSALFSCLAGALYAHFSTYLNPATYTTSFSTSFIVMMIVGGIGTISGCFIGAVVVSMLPELLRFMGVYYQFVYALTVLLVILFLPGGVVNSLRGRKNTATTQSLIKIFIGRREGHE